MMVDVEKILNDTRDRRMAELEKKLRETEHQNQLFMYRLLHIIEVASPTREINSGMQEIMDLAAGSRDAEMIESGVV